MKINHFHPHYLSHGMISVNLLLLIFDPIAVDGAALVHLPTASSAFNEYADSIY